MKVKILSRMGEDDPEVFENQINKFIKDKEVIDIKYQTPSLLQQVIKWDQQGNLMKMY